MAFIAGRVNDVSEPVIALQLVGGAAGDAEVECVVDTGFTGALVLPRAVVDQLGLPIVTHEEFRMVGGVRDSADIVLAQVHWLGEVRRVDVIVKEAYLVGAALLAGARLTVDYAAGTVLIEQT